MSEVATPDAILKVDDLRKIFRHGTALSIGDAGSDVVALDGVTFAVSARETFGIVGETGSGKSTLARCILLLEQPTAGSVTFDGVLLHALRKRELRELRSRVQIVFQDSAGALDSRMTVRALIEEGLVIHRGMRPRERREAVGSMLAEVGLPRLVEGRKPHELSGGQRQRVALARSLIMRPDLVILDEPVSAVDVSVQAQILNLLGDLQSGLGLTYLFIVHDLTVAEYMCTRIAVMYAGRVVETAAADQLFHSPLHPYTAALTSAAPLPDPFAVRRRARIVLKDESNAKPSRIVGCRFRARCPVGRNRAVCADVDPPLLEAVPRHWTACHFPGELHA